MIYAVEIVRDRHGTREGLRRMTSIISSQVIGFLCFFTEGTMYVFFFFFLLLFIDPGIIWDL